MSLAFNTDQKLTSQFAKPVVVGVASYALSMLMNPDYSGSTVTLPGVGIDIPVHLYFAIVGGTASTFTETLKNWVIPYIPQSMAAAQTEAALLGPVVHGVANDVITWGLYPGLRSDIGDVKIIGMAAGAQLGSSYLFDNFISPYQK